MLSLIFFFHDKRHINTRNINGERVNNDEIWGWFPILTILFVHDDIYLLILHTHTHTHKFLCSCVYKCSSIDNNTWNIAVIWRDKSILIQWNSNGPLFWKRKIFGMCEVQWPYNTTPKGRIDRILGVTLDFNNNIFPTSFFYIAFLGKRKKQKKNIEKYNKSAQYK